MPRVIQTINQKREASRTASQHHFHFALHRGPDKSSSDPYSIRRRLSFPRCSGVGYIAKQKHMRISGFVSLSLLIILLTLAVCPIVLRDTGAEATGGIESTTTITMTIGSTNANLNIMPKDTNGTFSSSTAAESAQFGITTNNYTGYTLTISASDDLGTLNNTTTSSTLSSITSVTDSSTFSSSTALNGKWGYLPSKYNSATNVAYLPSPTTVASTLDTTTTANPTTANDYTIGLGARVNYGVAAGTYTNTFVLSAVGNSVPYVVYYNDNSGDSTVNNIPSATTGTTKLTEATLSSTIPTRAGYTFKAWCTEATTDSGAVCSGTEYTAGSTFDFIDQTASSNVANLYATWTIDTYDLVINFSGVGISGVKVCTVAGDCAGTDLKGTVSTSGSSVAGLTYNNSYYLYPVFSNNTYYQVDNWTNTGTYGVLSSTTATNPTFTMGMGAGAVSVTTEYSPTTMQGFNRNICMAEASSVANTLTDVRDGKTYTVRYINGTCWMTQNLSFTGSSLNAIDSDVSTNKTLIYYDLAGTEGSSPTGHCYSPADGVSSSSSLGYEYPCIHSGTDSNGNPMVWYNYVAATARTVTGNDNISSTTESICPSGWRLPTGAEAGDISNADVYTSMFNISASGRYSEGSLQYGTTHASLWSSTASNATNRYNLRFAKNTSVLDISQEKRYRGIAIRCVLKDDRVLADITNMQEMNNDIAKNTANGTTSILVDTRDSRPYTVAKINGNIWMTSDLLYGYDSTNASATSGISSLTLYPTTSNVTTTRSIATYDIVEYGDSGEQCYGSGGTTGRGGVYTNPCIHSGSIEDSGKSIVWYNYVVLTAGTIKNSNSTDTTGNTYIATESICPRGWTLASKAQMQSITGATYTSIFSPSKAGYYRNGVLEQSGNAGVWFSSEAYDSSARYYLNSYSTNLALGESGRRRDQGNARCVQAS